MHSGRYPLPNSNPSGRACRLSSTDGLLAKVSPSGRAVLSAASVRSCSPRRLSACVKWRCPACNNPLASNLRKTRQLVDVYKVVKGGGGVRISHRALTHPNTRTRRIQNVQRRKRRNARIYTSFIISDAKKNHITDTLTHSGINMVEISGLTLELRFSSHKNHNSPSIRNPVFCPCSCLQGYTFISQ